MQLHPSHRAIVACIEAGVPVHIEGDPGVAKTATLDNWGTTWGRHVEVITGSSRDKGDFMGMPVEDAGRVVYSPPTWVTLLQGAKKGLLVLDELQSSSEAFDISMRIVQERVVGEAQLPDTVSVVAISNPVELAVNGQELPAPVANRFMHVAWHFDFDAWVEGIATDFVDAPVPTLRSIVATRAQRELNRAKIQGAVLGFLRSRPDLRNKAPEDPLAASKGWPSARSWTNAITAIAALKPGDEDARDVILRGLVGDGAFVEFTAWLATADLHDPVEVMADPSIVDWHGERPDRLFALVSSVDALHANAGKDDIDSWQQALAVMVACAEGGKPDVSTAVARRLLSAMPKGAKSSERVDNAFGAMMKKIGKSNAARV